VTVTDRYQERPGRQDLGRITVKLNELPMKRTNLSPSGLPAGRIGRGTCTYRAIPRASGLIFSETRRDLATARKGGNVFSLDDPTPTLLHRRSNLPRRRLGQEVRLSQQLQLRKGHTGAPFQMNSKAGTIRFMEHVYYFQTTRSPPEPFLNQWGSGVLDA